MSDDPRRGLSPGAHALPHVPKTAADRGDNTARWCRVCRLPCGQCGCRLGGCPEPAADRQTDEERCPEHGALCHGDSCCCADKHRAPPAVVLADLAGGINDEVRRVRVREAVARWLAWAYSGDDYADDYGSNQHWLEMADHLLALPEVAGLLDALTRVEALVADEERYRAEDPSWEITVMVPTQAGQETVERIFDAVADAAYDAQPEGRDWDVFVSGTGAPAAVPAHLLRAALKGESQ